MAIPTYNTRQTDSGSNPAAYNPFPAYKPWNPFPKQPQQTIQQRYPAYWRNPPSAANQAQQSQSPFGEQARRVADTPLPLPLARVQQNQANALAAQQEIHSRRNMAQLMSPSRQQSLFNIRGWDYNSDANGFYNSLSAVPYLPYGPADPNRVKNSMVREWKAAGGVNRQLTDWFDPYDPAGSPYMTSQYVPQTNYDYGGGYGYGGGWGGYSGGGYEHQDSASFYQGNYTQRRNRWNETLLTWGLRQE